MASPAIRLIKTCGLRSGIAHEPNGYRSLRNKTAPWDNNPAEGRKRDSDDEDDNNNLSRFFYAGNQFVFESLIGQHDFPLNR